MLVPDILCRLVVSGVCIDLMAVEVGTLSDAKNPQAIVSNERALRLLAWINFQYALNVVTDAYRRIAPDLRPICPH